MYAPTHGEYEGKIREPKTQASVTPDERGKGNAASRRLALLLKNAAIRGAS